MSKPVPESPIPKSKPKGIGLILKCSKLSSSQYYYQQAFPIWHPAWPMWTEITSLILMGPVVAHSHSNVKLIHTCRWVKI